MAGDHDDEDVQVLAGQSHASSDINSEKRTQRWDERIDRLETCHSD